MSKDSVASHRKFKAKHEIPFTLLSDPDGKVCEAYGVLKETKLFGMSIDRSTFIIDEEGKIAEMYRGIKVQGHIRDLLDRLSA